MMKHIRVFLTDDHSVLRDGLRAVIGREHDMEVIGEAVDGEECVRQCTLLQPDIVLLDINMPRLSGLEALEHLRTLAPVSRVLVLTMHDDVDYLRRVLASGGAGYILKEADSDELISAIRAVYGGGIYLHPRHAQALADPQTSAPAFVPASAVAEGLAEARAQLSEREIQVLRLMALGNRNSEIAETLHISVKTVETYKARIMQKLELTSRTALVRKALAWGLLEEE
jgi:two-component system response regulator NreC